MCMERKLLHCSLIRSFFTKGDSGGPLICGNHFVGIIEKGPVECDRGKCPTTFVHLKHYKKWIDNLEIGDEDYELATVLLEHGWNPSSPPTAPKEPQAGPSGLGGPSKPKKPKTGRKPENAGLDPEPEIQNSPQNGTTNASSSDSLVMIHICICAIILKLF